jgi:type IV pilus assembly protein PilA
MQRGIIHRGMFTMTDRRIPSRRGEKGFTLLEMMIVIAIIGIIAAIAIPQIVQSRIRGYNRAARSDVRNAYTAAQALFNDSPAASADPAGLIQYGYKPTTNVTLTATGTVASLIITGKHSDGTITYSSDFQGSIIP